MAKAQKDIPPVIIEVFNELIIENFCRGTSGVSQIDVIDRASTKGIKPIDLFDNGWMDIEYTFEKAGWKVKYYRPTNMEDNKYIGYTFTPIDK